MLLGRQFLADKVISWRDLQVTNDFAFTAHQEATLNHLNGFPDAVSFFAVLNEKTVACLLRFKRVLHPVKD